MKLDKIAKILDAKILAGKMHLNREIEYAFSSDLMSDVLTISDKRLILLTGLSNIQCLRTAEMADINQVIIARNKPVSAAMIKLAEETGIVLLSVDKSLFRASGMLYNEGLKPLF